MPPSKIFQNTMAKRKRTNTDLQNTTQMTKIEKLKKPLKIGVEGLAMCDASLDRCSC
jgi:hypothetical protein